MEPQAPVLFLALYNSQVEAVFRYHLARSGDWSAAQSLTADTFFGALERYEPRRVTAETESIWLWKIALAHQAGRNPRSDGLLFSGDVHPAQDQMSSFAQAAQATSEWQALPRPQRDALALLFFGGLSPEQVGQLIGTSGDRIWEIAAQHGSPVLFDLARTIHLLGYFQQRLENALQGRAGRRRKGVSWPETPFNWQISYRAGNVLRWILRLSVLGVLVYLLVTAWNSFQNASSPLPGPVAAPSPLPEATPTPDFIFNPLLDDLIVADQNDQLRLISLAESKVSVAISQEGFYPNKHLNPEFSPLVSPDGNWLALCRPLQDDTWLLSMDGKRQVRVSDHQVKLAWSPDSLSLISVDPLQAGRVEQIDVERAVSEPVFVNSHAQVLAAAYSPRGNGIGLAYIEGSRVRLEWISTNGKADQELANMPGWNTLSVGSFDLFFTADGREIWIPALHSAVTVPEGEVRPLEAEPFADQTGARGQRLGLNEIPPMTESSILSPDGLKAAVILKRIDTNAPSILTIYNGPKLATQRWMTYYGQIDALAWVVDSTSLFIQREGAQGPAILQIDAQSGKNIMYQNQARLIGTYSALRQMARRFAPQTEVVKGEGSFASGNDLKTAFLPGNQVSFRIPKNWRLWTQDDGGPKGTAIAANFSFADSLGWAALPPGFVMIGISQYVWNESRPLAQLVEMYAGNGPGQAIVRRIDLNGQEAYRLDFLKEDGTREPVVYFRTSQGDVSIWILHGSNQAGPYFDDFLKSIQITGEQPVSQIQNTPAGAYP